MAAGAVGARQGPGALGRIKKEWGGGAPSLHWLWHSTAQQRGSFFHGETFIKRPKRTWALLGRLQPLNPPCAL